MIAKGFGNIDTTFCGMWEMLIIIFVKKELIREVSYVKKESIAKGKLNLIGNKGSVAYSFVLRGRIFNFMGCHLRHGQKKFELRNKMASELIREFKL